MTPLSFVFLGLSITSSWGNGHATTYRGLVRELAARGHDVLFLERDAPWYAAHRDFARPPFARVELYDGTDDLAARFRGDVERADVVIVGSYVPDGAAVGRWVQRVARGRTAFYDIDTPVTLRKLAAGDAEYIARDLVGRYDVYLSFTGGPTLSRIVREHGAKAARALYCSVDPELYFPEDRPRAIDLGYLGTYSRDRQRALDALLVEPARRLPDARFVVAGAQYPREVAWPPNVARIEHVPPGEHRAFYNAQRFTLNVTRADMVRAGFSPSVRLFEAAACGTPIITDTWPGLDDVFVTSGAAREILVARGAGDTVALVRSLPDAERRAVAARARRRVLAAHTAAHRAEELERIARALLDASSARAARRPAAGRMPLLENNPDQGGMA